MNLRRTLAVSILAAVTIPVWTGRAQAFHLPVHYYCDGQLATIVGTNANDVIYGTSQADVIVGLGGNDKVYGLYGNDRICGNRGNDALLGGFPTYNAAQPDGNDRIFGGGETDRLLGGTQNDFLAAQDGVVNELVHGQAGADVCTWDPGDNVFSC